MSTSTGLRCSFFACGIGPGHPGYARGKTHRVLEPERNEPQKVKREASLCAYGMTPPVLRHFTLGPCVVPGASITDTLDAKGRIDGGLILLIRPVE